MSKDVVVERVVCARPLGGRQLAGLGAFGRRFQECAYRECFKEWLFMGTWAKEGARLVLVIAIAVRDVVRMSYGSLGGWGLSVVVVAGG